MTNQKTTKYAKQNMHVQAVVTQQKKDKMNYIQHKKILVFAFPSLQSLNYFMSLLISFVPSFFPAAILYVCVCVRM